MDWRFRGGPRRPHLGLVLGAARARGELHSSVVQEMSVLICTSARIGTGWAQNGDPALCEGGPGVGRADGVEN